MSDNSVTLAPTALPTFEEILARAMVSSRSEGDDLPFPEGFPLVLRVNPQSFRFSADSGGNEIDGDLLPPSPAHSATALQDHACLQLAARVLRETDFPVAFPTETVYGLAAAATNDSALANVFAAKNRPADNPLIVHVSNVRMAHSLCRDGLLPAVYTGVLQRFWPGALSVVAPKNERVSERVTAGQATVAIRMPSHPVARALISMAALPLAAPSANSSTRPSPTLASHVADDLARRVLLVIDAGPCESGIESTVLDAVSTTTASPCILRPGGVTFEMIRAVPDFEDTIVWRKGPTDVARPVVPGMKYKHYAPRIPVVLFERREDAIIDKKQARLLFLEAVRKRIAPLASDPYSGSTVIAVLRSSEVQNNEFNNSSGVTVVQVALGTTNIDVGHNLFKSLRDCESIDKCRLICVEGVDEQFEGLAVMNRIRKAAGETVFIG
ncbi:hypothetical protein HDU84_008543 [Entophlyctis sp. JEL0112]|nr:hypothetical protein HDU84_008543 [Entophlyctis sp. JEL0112]